MNEYFIDGSGLEFGNSISTRILLPYILKKNWKNKYYNKIKIRMVK